jgi:miniconductance mechanosensitive channel
VTETVRAWFESRGVVEAAADHVALAVGVLLVIAVGAATYVATRRVLIAGLARWARRTDNDWDDALVDRKVIQRGAHLAPALVAYVAAPVLLQGHDEAIGIARKAVLLVLVVVGIRTVDALIDAAYDIYGRLDAAREFPIRGPVQVAKIAVLVVGGLLLVALVVGQSPLVLVTSLGAFSAVLMLVFRDAILGFVAGLQLAANRMVAPGDWIEMPAYDADGTVLEVGLTTVKVQNADKTITMVPTYALISESFKNWRGMEESGGRRIKRAIHIDIGSIAFATDALLERFGDGEVIGEGARPTNVGLFRAHVEALLRAHPQVNQDMTFVVRQLAPTAHGLPIEVYVFCTETEWAPFEAVQADVFDHLLAIVPEFGLRVFQSPAGSDLERVAKSLRAER